jgi:putative ABC transport system permease protein
MRALDRKLLRDLWRLRGQVLAVGTVIASGVALLVMSLTSIEALQETASAYYDRYRFASVFAHVERAPLHVAARLAAIEGVQAVTTRVVRSAILDVDGFAEPVIGQLVSVPERGATALNALALRQGRLPRAAAPDEAVLSEPFALAHGLAPGDHVDAVLNGRWRRLMIVGVALSPEYVYTIGPGALMPDDRRFGVVWMGERALQAAFDLEGSFNDVSLGLLRGVDPEAVVDRVDRVLERYGSVGAYSRGDQLSNWFLMNEITQLKTFARLLPAVFLAVAAFLTNMVLARLVAVERSEIGLLKAFGYGGPAIAWHYVKLVLVICGVGIALGWFLGYWLGLYETVTYAEFYKFPFLLYRPGAVPFLMAALASLAAALLGTVHAVRKAAELPPAQAMQPPLPTLFRRSRLSRMRLARHVDQSTRIVLRQVARWPLRSFAASAGIGLAIAVLISSMQWLDALDHIEDVYFQQAQGQDVTVGFAQTRGVDALRSLARLPGVMAAEPMRAVPAKLHAGPRTQRESVQGVPAHQLLYRVYDASGRAVDLPRAGLVLSTMLARQLAVKPGDTVTIEVLDGRRPVLHVPVAQVFETYIGSPAYMDIAELNRLLREPPSVNAVHLRVDPRERDRLFRALKAVPQVSAVTLRDAAIDTFRATMARTLLIFVSFFVAFSCALAFGVTYNTARIALSERGRELATLRVLGFTRAEISYILLGETGVLALVALPLGLVSGYALARALVQGLQTELFRVPFVITSPTYGWALLVGIAATAASALLVRRRLDRLDLIGVLKTRE